MTGRLRAAGFPEASVRARARAGTRAAFPSGDAYGSAAFGAVNSTSDDLLDALRLVPPVFMPRRLEKLIDLGREPTYRDVALDTVVGGFATPLPLYVSAFGSTRVASSELGPALSRQAGALGLPLVIGENVAPVNGAGHSLDAPRADSLLRRVRAYAEAAGERGGLVVQQSTEDADAEVWHLVYSTPDAADLLRTGRVAFELKTGQGAKPGLAGMTVLPEEAARGLGDRYALDPVLGPGVVLRSSSPGTFTEEILRQQIRLMRNNFPLARIWVKLHPGRDVAAAAEIAWLAGADAVTVDGAEAGTGWAPHVFLDQVGLPLAECLRRIDPGPQCLLASGRMWEGGRVAKALAMGARAAGLGRAALLAVDEDPGDGLRRLVECLALELRMLVSAVGKYTAGELAAEDLWGFPDNSRPARTAEPANSFGDG